jgi:hypothetical protein
MIIAVSLEALVFIFRTGTTNMSELIYPTGLLVASVFLVMGLNWYQSLSSVVEKNRTFVCAESFAGLIKMLTRLHRFSC